MMEVCKVSEDIIKVENEIIGNVSDGRFDINVSSKTVNRIDHDLQIRSLDEQRRDQMPINITDVCPIVVSGNSVMKEDNCITKAICKEFIGYDNKKIIHEPDSVNSLKDCFLMNDVNDNTEKHTSNVLSEDSELHYEFLNSVCENAEKVLFQLTETCVLSSNGHVPCINECERTIPENHMYCSGNNSNSVLEINDLNGVSDILPESNETNNPLDKKNYRDSDVSKSRNCNDQKIKFFKKSTKKEDYNFMLKSRGESHIETENNDNSDSVSADEKKENGNKLKIINNSENRLGDMGMSGETSLHTQLSHRQDILSLSETNHTAPPASGPFLYKCVNCSFSDWHLENLTSHVIACFRKRTHIEGQESFQDGKPPTKVCVLSSNQEVVLQQPEESQSKHVVSTRPKFSLVPKIEPPTRMPRIEQCVSLNPRFSNDSNIDPFLLLEDLVPVSSKSQFIISPQTELVTSSKDQHTATLKTEVNNASKTQIMVSPQAQLSDATNTVYAITPNAHFSNSKPQIIINTPSQPSIASEPQVAVPVQKNSTLKPQITLTPEAKLMPNVQPVITLQTQLPSSSQSQIVSTPKTQFPLVPGTKLTLGPHSPVPIMPQTPLTISPQGLTISQTGSQLLITTKLQPNNGGPNQPTLLGLGIGTNPTAAPKNIVLLPNLLFNSVSPTSGYVNDKQIPGMIQGQFVLQTPTTAVSSVAPVQIPQNLVYTPQTLKSQQQVLLSPLYTVSGTSVSETSSTTSVVQPKSSVTVSQSKALSEATSASTSTKNSSGEQSTSILDKFICEICDDYVKDSVKLRSHMQCLHAINIHPKMMPSFNCQKCQFRFFTEQGLERHLVGCHSLVTTSMQEAAEKGKDGGRCPICGWGYQSKLLQHLVTEHKLPLKPADLSYKCTLCTATFAVYKQFEDHVHKVHRSAMSKLPQGNSQSSSSAIK